jgi:hypothetical protein
VANHEGGRHQGRVNRKVVALLFAIRHQANGSYGSKTAMRPFDRHVRHTSDS